MMSKQDHPEICQLHCEKKITLSSENILKDKSKEFQAKGKLLRKCSPFNIYSLLHQRQQFSKYSTKAFNGGILKNLIKGRYGQYSVHFEDDYEDEPISSSPMFNICKPSLDGSNLLLSTSNVQLWSVDKVDLRKHLYYADNKIRLPQDTQLGYGKIKDFFYASAKHKYSGAVVAYKPIATPSNFQIILFPDFKRKTEMFIKEVENITKVCLWKDYRLIYSSGSKAIIVKDIDDHFAHESAWNAGSIATSKTQENLQNHVTALDYKTSLLFSGHQSEGVFVYDEREDGRNCLSIYQEKYTSCIKVLSDDRSVLLKSCSSGADVLSMWDIRFPSGPVLLYDTLNARDGSPQVLGKTFFVDLAEQVVSCDGHKEGTICLWSVKSGKHLVQDLPQNKGMYSSYWPILKNKCGTLGFEDITLVLGNL